jgi:Flp pilus assembly protein TadD
VARARTPNDQYLAHLFLGRIHEDGERLDQTLSEYRRAVEVSPEGQSAAVALSHALQIAGEAEEARRALARGILDGEREADAYSDYLAINTAEAEPLEAALHRETLE